MPNVAKLHKQVEIERDLDHMAWTPEQLRVVRALEARLARLEREAGQVIELCPTAARIHKRLRERGRTSDW